MRMSKSAYHQNDPITLFKYDHITVIYAVFSFTEIAQIYMVIFFAWFYPVPCQFATDLTTQKRRRTVQIQFLKVSTCDFFVSINIDK